MEPLTVAAAFVNISVIVIELAQLIQKLSVVNDPRIKLVSSKLIIERRKFANWCRSLKIQNIKDLEPNVEPADYKQVVECYEDVERYIEYASKEVSKLDRLEKKDLKAMLARVRWLYGSFEELQLLVETLREMVLLLYTIAPPPPLYNRMVWHNEASSTQDTSLDTERRPGLSEVDITYLKGPDDGGTSFQNKETKLLTPILNMYKKCMEALQMIKAQTSAGANGAITGKAYTNLKIWGTGILDGPFALDKLLRTQAMENEDSDTIGTAVIAVLADLALIEDQMLGWLSRECDDYERRKVEQMQLDVIAILGMEGVDEFASARMVPDLQDEEDATALSKASQRLLLATEDLYELLPSIRSVRRERLLQDEVRNRSQIAPASSAVQVRRGPLLSPPEEAVLSDWVDWSVESTTYMELKLFHEMKDDMNKRSPTDQKYYDMLRKQNDKFKEWAKSMSKSKSSNPSSEEEKKIKEALLTFSRNLPVTKSSPPGGEIDTTLDEKSLLKLLDNMKSTNEVLASVTSPDEY